MYSTPDEIYSQLKQFTSQEQPSVLDLISIRETATLRFQSYTIYATVSCGLRDRRMLVKSRNSA